MTTSPSPNCLHYFFYFNKNSTNFFISLLSFPYLTCLGQKQMNSCYLPIFKTNKKGVSQQGVSKFLTYWKETSK